MFYHLFQNRDKKYIYDVNNNLVSYISDELFTDLQKQHSCNELCEKEYEILLEKGFFKDYQFKQLYNPLSKRIEYLNDRNLSFFINVNLKMYSFDHLRMYNFDHIDT